MANIGCGLFLLFALFIGLLQLLSKEIQTAKLWYQHLSPVELTGYGLLLAVLIYLYIQIRKNGFGWLLQKINPYSRNTLSLYQISQGHRSTDELYSRLEEIARQVKEPLPVSIQNSLFSEGLSIANELRHRIKGLKRYGN